MLEFRVSPLATEDELTTTHSPDYVSRYLRGDLTERELRNVGFPWDLQNVRRSLSSTGGTVAAAKAVCEALRKRQHQQQQMQQHDSRKPIIWAAHVAGGTHHAFYDRGEGFCVFSDIAVAANVVLRNYPDVLRRILILDLDVHQGNGNAVLFQGRSDVITFSLHCEANYFSRKEQSDLDIELPAGCTDGTYLGTLQHWLRQLKRQGGGGDDYFDLVFFQAGVDVLEQDRLGRMSLTPKGVRRRNELVFDFCRELRLPLVLTMGGGYPQNEDSWQPILDAHANVYIQAWQYLQTNG
jgi:acetoin utilization deacetylase AcuC-like enzyme